MKGTLQAISTLSFQIDVKHKISVPIGRLLLGKNIYQIN